MCRVNLEYPKPGSEKMGLLELAPDSVYGDRPCSVQAKYFEERPPITQGTEMDAGIAFGIRGDKDFDLLEQSALHDVSQRRPSPRYGCWQAFAEVGDRLKPRHAS
jgi:hypothetical protein